MRQELDEQTSEELRVITEMIAFEKAQATTIAVAASVVLLISVIYAIRLYKAYDLHKNDCAEKMLLSITFAAMSATLLIASVHTIMKITFAPKVFIIEEAAKLIK